MTGMPTLKRNEPPLRWTRRLQFVTCQVDIDLPLTNVGFDYSTLAQRMGWRLGFVSNLLFA
jgi:hypothetical protein